MLIFYFSNRSKSLFSKENNKIWKFLYFYHLCHFFHATKPRETLGSWGLSIQPSVTINWRIISCQP